MKKLLLATFVFLAFGLTSTIQAQGYIRGGVGLGIGTVKDAFGYYSLTRNNFNTAINHSVLFGSFGEGGRFALAGGYMITPYFGIELEIGYFAGLRQNYGETKTLNSDGSINYYNLQRKGYSYQLRGLPSLVIQAPEGTKFQPFARFGVLIPFYGRTMIEEETYLSATSTNERVLEVQGKFSLGFESSVGLKYNINDNLGIYVQATYTGLRIRSDKANVIIDRDVDSDGNVTNDKLPNTQVFMKEIEFQDVIDEDSNISYFITQALGVNCLVDNSATLDPEKPLNLPTQTSNFNSIAFSLGVQYTFGKK
ncbi:MAG: porin family protein [Saprospiraceae bacterium]|nr:porin family protein [Saprospiraceae bacterium]